MTYGGLRDLVLTSSNVLKKIIITFCQMIIVRDMIYIVYDCCTFYYKYNYEEYTEIT